MIDAIGIENSWASFTVFAVTISLNIGSMVLSSQAFGTKNHYLVGTYYHRALIANWYEVSIGIMVYIEIIAYEILVIFASSYSPEQFGSTFWF